VAGPGADGGEAGLDGAVDGTLCADDQRGQEVRRVGHAGAGRLERGVGARGFGHGDSAAQGGVKQGTVRWGCEAPAGAGGVGADRRVRVRRAAPAGGAWADVVRGAVEACRFEAGWPEGVRGRGGGVAV